MRQLVLYIHGKGGNAMEADHYKALFAGYDVVGLAKSSSQLVGFDLYIIWR